MRDTPTPPRSLPAITRLNAGIRRPTPIFRPRRRPKKRPNPLRLHQSPSRKNGTVRRDPQKTAICKSARRAPQRGGLRKTPPAMTPLRPRIRKKNGNLRQRRIAQRIQNLLARPLIKTNIRHRRGGESRKRPRDALAIKLAANKTCLRTRPRSLQKTLASAKTNLKRHRAHGRRKKRERIKRASLQRARHGQSRKKLF